MAGPMTLAQIVARLGGRVAAGPDTLIHQVASLESADARHISFFTGKRHRAKLDATRAAAVIVAPDAEGDTARPRIVPDVRSITLSTKSILPAWENSVSSISLTETSTPGPRLEASLPSLPTRS